MWIPITLLAAVFQILRTSRQHELRATLSTTGAAYVRYLYGAPLALVAAVGWFGISGAPLPATSAAFWIWITIGGLAQIGGTIALLQSFRRRDFAIGTVYAKTEVIQIAVISSVALGEPLRPLGWLGALVCMAGVAILASNGSLLAIIRRAGDPAALLGIIAGGLFGFASIGIRGASTSLGDHSVLDRSMFTLAALLILQAVLNGAYLACFDRQEVIRTVLGWRVAWPVGVLSLAGTAGWTLAMTLENAAKVRTLGQVELILAFVIARRRHGDHHTVSEMVATAIVLVGIVLVTTLG